MNPQLIGEIVQTSLQIGAAVAGVVAQAIHAGDVSTLEALRGVVPEPERLRAVAMAEVASQRARAEQELGQ